MADPDVLILGAGASGLMAALTLAQRGRRVALLDHAARAGRKLCLAGGGKGNVTNLRMRPDRYISQNPDFCRSALAGFTPQALLARLEAWGIAWEEREFGQIFCARPSQELVESLEAQSRALDCAFLLGRRIAEAGQNAAGFFVETDRERLIAPQLVIALGGTAWPQAGASDLGWRLARRFGHNVIPPRPVLAPFLMPPAWPLHGLAGISLDVLINPSPAAEPMSLLFTHQGLSGPAALMASCVWTPNTPLIINFLPGRSLESLLDDPAHGRRKLANLLKTLLPDRLALLLPPAQLLSRNVAELSRADRRAIASAIHAHTVTPLQTAGLRKAEAVAGGVDTAHVSSRNMESRLVPNLFFIGEVLDVTGLLGGYNLHWAWASAAALT